MLPFSSITSLIPLLLLGFAYLIYFCASVFIKPVILTNEAIATQEKNSTEAIEPASQQNDYPDYRILADNEITADAVITKNAVCCEPCFRLPSGTNNLRLADLHRVAAFFPRPPPAL